MGIIKPILQAYFNEWTAQDTVLASSGSAVPCGPWPSGNWYPQDTHSGICTPTTPTSGELRGALFGAPLDTLQAGGVAGAGRAEELCTAARCAAVGTRGRISRLPGRNRLPQAGEGLGSRPGREPGGRAGERASKELSGARGRAPVRREHVQFAAHPCYG